MIKLGNVLAVLFLPVALLSQEGQKRFKAIPAISSGIDFQNIITESEVFNFFRYMNVYNGGGVAVGDVNNDGLPDLYFTGNQVENKLYLNKGALKFEDITNTSGTAGTHAWTTGVSMVDVNGDGWLDIYVCQAGPYVPGSDKLKNLLFINKGDLTFDESAAQYGLADGAASMHATFFDMDNDNDLDVYVVNHPANFNTPIEDRVRAEQILPESETDRLYRNDGNVFVDVTDKAGIKNWAFGLSCTAADLNGDGWVDLYVGNDYSERDNYWVNQGDGTFKEGLFDSFMHIPNFSMGGDAADINNDGKLDLMVVDMVAEDNRRKKANMSGMNPKAFWDNVDKGRHYQYMQNALQLNNGNGTFSDIAELSGVAYTDWSWSPVLADLDNDGWKDILITNGLRRDVRNADYTKHVINTDLLTLYENHETYTEDTPVEPIANYTYHNKKDLTFQDVGEDWGLSWKGFSNGMVVADLDRDGDLDLVQNNIDTLATIFENKSNGSNYLLIEAEGTGANPKGIGLKVWVKTTTGQQFCEMKTSSGYQSCGEAVLHFGLDQVTSVDEIEVRWPDGKGQVLRHVKSNQRLVLKHEEAVEVPEKQLPNPWLRETSKQAGLNFKHEEQPHDDYEKQLLLPHKYSQLGPFMAQGDVNGDGLEDVFVGGAKGQSGALFLQLKGRKFAPFTGQGWEKDQDYEDMGAVFFDADGDSDLDLYVCSGSNEMEKGHASYADRLYLNDGKGIFSRGTLPDMTLSSSRVRAADFDGDGDLDLCVGGRMVPGAYPEPTKTTILENEGGTFKDVTHDVLPELEKIGMVTDMQWCDYDQDGDVDLILVGEWMAPQVFQNMGGQFKNVTAAAGLSAYTGWWYSLTAADIDQDGDLDFIAGNLGLNAKYRATMDEPFQVHYRDFDENGSADVVLGYFNQGKVYPVRGRQCSSEQIPTLAEAFPTYEAFSTATLEDVYGLDLNTALHYKAGWMNTSYIENLGNGTFKVQSLPNEAQFSAVQGVAIQDVTGDGLLDVVLVGNMLHAEVETQRYDASIGLILKGNGKGEFEPLTWEKTGLFAWGDVKDIAVLLDDQRTPLFILSRNDGPLSLFTFR